MLAEPQKQSTIGTIVGIAGHTGEKVNVSIRPFPNGIIFRRVDLPHQPIIEADYSKISSTMMSTNLSNQDGITISTVEHILSACSALNISDICIDVSGPEIPMMDGSAIQFLKLLTPYAKSKPSRYLRVKKETFVENKYGHIKLLPSDSSTFDISINGGDRRSKVFDNQRFSFDLITDNYEALIADARTFGFLEDAEKLRANGLALGASLSNTVVIDGDTIANPEGLRHKQELARHKILDAIGDLYLLGGRLIGHFQGHNSGHGLNQALMVKLMENPDNYEWLSSIT